MNTYQLLVNGEPVTVAGSDDALLVHVLRDGAGRYGTRYGCGLEQCGACRVLIDGELAYSCTLRIADVAGRAVTTVESLGNGHPLVEAFVALNAGQCGFCLSGILITADQLLRRNPGASRQEIQQALKDHLCRCGAHNRIIRAIAEAATHYPLESRDD